MNEGNRRGGRRMGWGGRDDGKGGREQKKRWGRVDGMEEEKSIICNNSICIIV